MKKALAILFAVCLMCSSVVVAFAKEDISDKVETNVSPLYEIDDCKLIVNGKEVNSKYSDHIKIYYDDNGFTAAQVPIFEVIRALGGYVLWIGGNAIVFYKTGVFFYDSEHKHLNRIPQFAGSRSEIAEFFFELFDLFENPYAGGKGVYEKYSVDKELIITDTLFINCKIAFNIKITKNIEQKTIEIENRSISELIEILAS